MHNGCATFICASLCGSVSGMCVADVVVVAAAELDGVHVVVHDMLHK